MLHYNKINKKKICQSNMQIKPIMENEIRDTRMS